MHKANSFITLTYTDEKRPYKIKSDGQKVWCLERKHLTQFLKSLRHRLLREYGSEKKIRFFATGEYGTLSRQCHFHLIVFGLDAQDWKTKRIVSDVWHKGRTSTLPVIDGGAEYCAKHQSKYDATVDLEYQAPPFQSMSTHPGIGLRWLEIHKNSLMYEGHEMAYLKWHRRGDRRASWHPAPRYYIDKIYNREQKKLLREMQQAKRNNDLKQWYGFKWEYDLNQWLKVNAETKENRISWNKCFGRNRGRGKI
jgi:hypothetical protein